MAVHVEKVYQYELQRRREAMLPGRLASDVH